MRLHLAALAGLVLAIGTAAPAAAAPAALYGGHTSDDAPIVLRVSADGRALKQLSVYADTTCDDGTTSSFWTVASFAGFSPVTPRFGTTVFSPGRVSRRGSFRATGLERDTYDESNVGTSTQTLSGSIRSGIAHGTYSVSTEIVDANGAHVATCSSPTIRWEARSAPGRTYAGVTSDGLPVVVQRDRSGRQVEDLWLAWTASCQAGGFLSIGDHFAGLHVSGSGRISRAYDLPLSLDGGATATVSYSLAGSVGARRASGTFRVVFTERDAAGAQTDSCDSTLLRWTASSTKGKAPKPGRGEIRRVGAAARAHRGTSAAVRSLHIQAAGRGRSGGRGGAG